MLITNFSAGELSETLFGRTDISQYYNGAARVENFDIIPTGGIKRRSGMKHIKGLSGEGRIIPFIINREFSFLLYLTPGNITVFRIENNQITEIAPEINSITKSYETLKHIREVQYAQSFDTMILCHEEYRPLEIKFNQEFLYISPLEMNFIVPVVAGYNVTEEEAVYGTKSDERYMDNGWLTSEGNYPASVSFLNGRLFFANTKNNRQRIFVSAVKESDKNYNFFTKKIFLNEKKEYENLIGYPRAETNKFELEDVFQLIKLTKNPEDYIVEKSFLYPEGTIIENINDTEVTFSNTVNSLMLTQAEQAALAKLEEDAERYDLEPRVAEIGCCISKSAGQVYNPYYRVHVSTAKVVIEQYATNSSNTRREELVISNTEAEYMYKYKEFKIPYDINSNHQVLLRIVNKTNEMIAEFWGNNNYALNSWHTENYGYFEDLVNYMYDGIGCTRNYKFREKVYKGNSAEDITRIIRNKYLEDGDIAFVPLYTRELISEEKPTPDCGFTFEIASDVNDAIKWLAVNKGLIVGTEMGEWIIPSGVHALEHVAISNTSNGSDKIQGTAVGDATIFLRAGKKSLIEYYPNDYDNFRANNMALMAPQMLDEGPNTGAVEFDFISSPYTKLLVTREDGVVVTLLYERSTGTFAWGRISTWGNVKSIAVLPGEDGNDDVYMLVERESKFYLERLREDGKMYLDSYRVVNRDNWEEVSSEYYGNDIKICRVYETSNINLPPEPVMPQEPVDRLPDYIYYEALRRYQQRKKEYDEAVARNAGQEVEKQTVYETLDGLKEPDWHAGSTYFIGYQYRSTVRTMPVLANDEMKKQRIASLVFRFLNSHLVKMTSIAGGKEIKTDTLTAVKPPYSGICKQPFPGTWDEDVQAELWTEEAAPVKILALNAEMQGGQA